MSRTNHQYRDFRDLNVLSVSLTLPWASAAKPDFVALYAIIEMKYFLDQFWLNIQMSASRRLPKVESKQYFEATSDDSQLHVILKVVF